jgi:phage baseplate assembly protein V
MISVSDLSRFLDPLKRKIFLLVGRAIITAVNNSGKTQFVQVTALKDETISDIERMEEYGFATYPKTGAEALINFINGNRDHGLIVCIHDRNYRPTDLAEGDVRVYDYRGNKITCKSTGIELECLNGNKIEMVSGAIKCNGTNLEVLL